VQVVAPKGIELLRNTSEFYAEMFQVAYSQALEAVESAAASQAHFFSQGPLQNKRLKPLKLEELFMSFVKVEAAPTLARPTALRTPPPPPPPPPGSSSRAPRSPVVTRAPKGFKASVSRVRRDGAAREEHVVIPTIVTQPIQAPMSGRLAKKVLSVSSLENIQMGSAGGRDLFIPVESTENVQEAVIISREEPQNFLPTPTDSDGEQAEISGEESAEGGETSINWAAAPEDIDSDMEESMLGDMG
jgi:hypothetical protein